MNKQITLFAQYPTYAYSKQSEGKYRDVQKIEDLLFQNFIMVDLEKRYNELIQLAFDSIEEETPLKQEILRNWGMYYAQNARSVKVTGEFSELKLCNATSDKIYFSPLLTQEEILSHTQNYNYIKFCTLNNIEKICPILPFKVKLMPGEKYDLQELIAIASTSSREMKVIDPYIYNKHAIFNLEKIVGNQFFSKIVIKALPFDKIMSKTNTKSSRFDLNGFESLVRKLKRDGSKVEIEYFKTSEHQQRYIQFDEVQIEIPGGLDFLGPQGKYSDTKEVGYLRFERREF